MKELTVIIPFLNEGFEVYNTVKSIRESSLYNLVDIILINDASDDNFNYENISKEFGTIYIHHTKRKGVAYSRDEGVSICSTKYFLLLDAHMRIDKNRWVEELIYFLKNNENGILCCQTVPFEIDIYGCVKRVNIESFSFGAYIDFEGSELNTRWNYVDTEERNNIIDIPCILGAAYASSKKYWLYLNGLKGLCYFGFDEQLISIKTWLEGGKCKLLKNIEFWHLYRKRMPYKNNLEDYFYNKLYLAELFLKDNDKNKIYNSFQQANKPLYNIVINKLNSYRKYITDQKSYYEKIFRKDIDFVIEYNKVFHKMNVRKKLMSSRD